ncbi:MAG: sel1 repeat family protein, partial [Synergistaceae bacterium]|nr:sel1 repeat family protein [Synergistaceae bacterium]
AKTLLAALGREQKAREEAENNLQAEADEKRKAQFEAERLRAELQQAQRTREQAEDKRKVQSNNDPTYAKDIYELGEYHHKAGNYAEACRLYLSAAEKGYLPAIFQMGWIYQHGYYGMKKDYSEAIKWYRKAAEQGNATAQQILREGNWS